MKRKILQVIFLMILTSLLGSSPALCGEIDTNSQLIKYYENFLNEKISKCHSKAQLKKSKSAHLRNCAHIEIKKANYLIENKEMLIKEMAKSDIGVKQYKIEYFLNRKFYENKKELYGKKL